MRKINVAVVGCGYVADGHLKAWRKSQRANVVAISDLNEKLARQTAEFWKIPKYYSSLTNLLANADVDLVDICTPPHTHADLAIEAMKAGVNVLIEKPMTITVKDAERIVECQKATKVKAGVIHNWLFDDPVLKANSIVKEGKLGEVYNIKIEALNTKYDPMVANERHWCHKMPGGRFGEMLAHPIYLVRHFLKGEPLICDIQVSKIGDYPWMKSDELCAILKVNEKLGMAYASFNSSRDAVYINLYGTKGIIKIDLINSILTFMPKMKINRFSKGFDSLRQAGQIFKCTVKNMSKIISKRWMTGHDMYIKLFAESIINDDEPPVSVIDGLAVTKTLEEACLRIEQLERASENSMITIIASSNQGK